MIRAPIFGPSLSEVRIGKELTIAGPADVSTIPVTSLSGSSCNASASLTASPGAKIPRGKLVMGVPAKVRRDLSAEEIEEIMKSAENYVINSKKYMIT